MAEQDDIGNRGEDIFRVRITDFCGGKRPFFRPRFLGEKAETVDFLVELVDAGPTTPFFFVQVKTTRLGYTRRTPRRLRIDVAPEDVGRLGRRLAPVYLVGIDEVQEAGYILAILTGSRFRLSSFPTVFPLDCINLPRLYDEVKQCWEGRTMALSQSVFTE